MKDTIFISIASYRDKECSTTLDSIFTNAKDPSNIYVGICQQNKDTDNDCIPTDIENNYKNNIKIIRISNIEARGPTFARYWCSTLWNNEEYYLQIDSHTQFIKDWDKKLINMIKTLKSEGVKKPLLSSYPLSSDDYKKEGEETTIIPVICKSFFNERDMLSFEGAELLPKTKDFIKCAYIAAGMFFCESKFLKEVPFDPHLEYLFVGEEILHTIRFWTSGYDIYAPNENVLFHVYTREDEPKIWSDDPHYSDEPAFEKVKKLIGLESNYVLSDELEKSMKVYGLGKERTLQEFYEYTGIDIHKKTVHKDFCKQDETIENFNIIKIKKPKYYIYITLILLILTIIIFLFNKIFK